MHANTVLGGRSTGGTTLFKSFRTLPLSAPLCFSFFFGSFETLKLCSFETLSIPTSCLTSFPQ